MRRISIVAASLVFGLAAASALGEIDYHVKVDPTQKRLEVTMLVPWDGVQPLSFQAPKWSPGSYSYHGAVGLNGVEASDGTGNSIALTHPDATTWTVKDRYAFADDPGERDSWITVRYWIAYGGGRFGGGGGGGAQARGRDDSFVQVSGPSTYLYVVGRKKESCKVTFDVPKDWPVLVGLDEASGPPNTYSARTFDVLADNPMSTGDVIVDHYKLRDKDHYIVLEGAAKSQVNREKLLKDCRFVSAAETDFWGGAPYHKYIWHFAVRPGADGAGGLEHLSSTQITLSAGEGPLAQSVLSHEYFHLWNVKRIRPAMLGPFDYETLPKTGALWWLEGVTDYYAWLLPYRYGEWERPMFYNGIIRNYTAVENNPAHLTVSPYDSSLRVGDANGGRGNSQGFEISYYNLGWLCGMCLDTEIRARTHGRRSLDDVAHALFQECKNDQPGFAEDEIRNLCIRFGGPSMADFYDRTVMKPGELPVAEQLAKMGLKLVSRGEPYVEVGFAVAPAFGGGGGVRVGAVRGPAVGKLVARDLVQSINGTSLDGKSPQEVTALVRSIVEGAKVGTPITLVVLRDDKPVTVTVDPVEATRALRTVEEDPNASPAARALGEQWLARKKPAVE